MRHAPPEQCRFVLSDGGKWHRVAASGLAGTTCSWTSACGWRFGGSLASLKANMPEGVCYKFLCARCFPALRDELKVAAEQ